MQCGNKVLQLLHIWVPHILVCNLDNTKLTDSAACQTAGHSSRGIIRLIKSALKLTCSSFTSVACTLLYESRISDKAEQHCFHQTTKSYSYVSQILLKAKEWHKIVSVVYATLFWFSTVVKWQVFGFLHLLALHRPRSSAAHLTSMYPVIILKSLTIWF